MGANQSLSDHNYMAWDASRFVTYAIGLQHMYHHTYDCDPSVGAEVATEVEPHCICQCGRTKMSKKCYADQLLNGLA